MILRERTIRWQLSRPTHLLPLRSECLVTLGRRVAENYLVCGDPLLRSVQTIFTPLRKLRRNQRSYMRAEVISGMVFVSGEIILV